jgi:CRP/FNR family cyclic AMP-dependent transcriptional regulator
VYLERVGLFIDMDRDSLDRLQAGARSRVFTPGQMVVQEGDEGNTLYVVQNGCLKVFLMDEQGREVTLSLMGPGDFFGELALLDDEPRSASVMTIERSEVLLVPRAVFSALWESDPDFRRGVARNLARQVRLLSENVRAMALVDVFGRISRLFSTLAVERDGMPIIERKLTQQDIANFVGASREMVNRILRELVTGGYISIDQQQIQLLKKLPPRW